MLVGLSKAMRRALIAGWLVQRLGIIVLLLVATNEFFSWVPFSAVLYIAPSVFAVLLCFDLARHKTRAQIYRVISVVLAVLFFLLLLSDQISPVQIACASVGSLLFLLMPLSFNDKTILRHL